MTLEQRCRRLVVNPSIAKRFWAKVNVTNAEGCWEWIGAVSPSGYGSFGLGTKITAPAHRVAFALSNCLSVLPDKFVCHHCDNPRCVNPFHLFLGTHTDNMRDMIAKNGHYNRKKTHCRKGHEYTPENTALTRRGWRECVICHREQCLRSFHKRKILPKRKAKKGKR